VQAATGIMARFGGGLETPEEHAHFGTIDVLGGVCAAFGAAVALYKRAKGGGPDVARASLAAAGQLIQMPYMYDYEGRPPFDEPSGRDVLGERPSYRCYEAADGWFFLACPADRLLRLAELPGLELLTRLDDEAEIVALLAHGFSAGRVEHWLKVCRRLDIGAQRLETMTAVRDAHLVDESTTPVELAGRTILFTRNRCHPSGRIVDLVAPTAIRPRRAAISSPAPAPKYGVDSGAILADSGYSPEEIDALMLSGIVGRQWSDDYLPD
jgi:crotonobetainyl-CoA:carnitine CoA-transferase CaiB-like acyl-CoA transferase